MDCLSNVYVFMFLLACVDVRKEAPVELKLTAPPILNAPMVCFALPHIGVIQTVLRFRRPDRMRPNEVTL